MHHLHAEVAAAAICDRLHIEAVTIVTDLQGPSIPGHVRADHDGRGTSVLADILYGLLGDSEDYRAFAVVERIARPAQVDHDADPRGGPETVDRVSEGIVEAGGIDGGRPQFGDELADICELSAKHRAKLLETGKGTAGVSFDQALDVIDLEDRIG